MTVYVTDGVDVARFLWADTDDEAIIAAMECGVANAVPAFKQWWAYVLTLEQWALAIGGGAQLADRWEPRYQMALREGDVEWITRIEDLRARGR